MAKNRKLTKIICAECKKPAYTRLSEIKRGNGRFCSLKCVGVQKKRNLNELRIKREKNCECFQCKKKFYRTKSKYKNSRSGLQFCSRKCKDNAQRLESKVHEIQPDHYGTGIYSYKKIARRHHDSTQCARCKYNKLKKILVVHHKDRNRNNNSPENLEILCPNCHEEDHFLNKDGRYKNNSEQRKDPHTKDILQMYKNGIPEDDIAKKLSIPRKKVRRIIRTNSNLRKYTMT